MIWQKIAQNRMILRRWGLVVMNNYTSGYFDLSS